MNSIVLCGPSAEALLEDALLTDRKDLMASDVAMLPASARLSFLRDEANWPISINGRKFSSIDILVSARSELRHIPRINYHVWSTELPPGALTLIARGLYVCTGPFLALLASRQQNLIGLTQYMMYLTGRYCLHQADPLQERPQLMTLEQIDRSRHAIDGKKGCGLLSKALYYCHEGTRSPQEGNLLICSVFPRIMGGYKFAHPQVNYQIELNGELANLAGHNYLEIDLYWKEAKIGLEYNGIDSHRGGLTPYDITRQYVLKEQGIDILYVTKEQMYNAKLLDIVMRRIAKKLGVSTASDRWPSLDRVQGLLDSLHNATGRSI